MNIGNLEAMVEHGTIIEYTIERKAGRAYVTAHYLEYDRDSPRGTCNTAKGHGVTVNDAIADVIKIIPAMAGVPLDVRRRLMGCPTTVVLHSGESFEVIA